jgi:hypothetical protein
MVWGGRSGIPGKKWRKMVDVFRGTCLLTQTQSGPAEAVKNRKAKVQATLKVSDRT